MWLFENPLPVLFLGVLATAVLAGILYMTGRISVLIALIGSVLLCGVLLLVERLVVTEAEQVDLILESIARAIQRNDLNDALQYISTSAPEVRESAKQRLPRMIISSATITSRIDVKVSRGKSRLTAVARFTARIVGNDKQGYVQDGHYVRFFIVRLRKEKGMWRVTDYEERDPITRR